MKHWKEMKPEEVVSRIYWMRGQIPPKNWRDNWPKIKKQLEERDK